MVKKRDCQPKHSKKEKCLSLWQPNAQSYIFSLLCIVLLFPFLDYIPSMAAGTYDFDDGKYQYRIIDEDASKVEIVGQINLTGEVEIPQKASALNGKEYGVTSIGGFAFQYAENITSITIPNSVNSIGMYAFAFCSSLTSVTISDSVTSIGVAAFSSCRSLTSITISDSVTSIEDSMFRHCRSLTSITIPNNVTSIGDYAFNDCISLASIAIPDNVTSIGTSAFNGCMSLTSITIPDSVVSIGGNAFGYCSRLTGITIPGSVTCIEYSTFDGCSSLTSITIPDSVISIGDSAFSSCRSLTSITIPDSVTSIGNSAFDGCMSLTSIEIPDSVTSIGNSAFDYCSSLTSITIPDSVTSIGTYAFSNCDILKNCKITISENHNETPTIGDRCFEGCPDDRYLIFLTEDGTTKLDTTTKPTFEEAAAAYRAVNDGNTSDDLWYGWKIKADNASVIIRVMKDGKPWSDHGKQFALKTDEDQDFITDLTDGVADGTYKIYDITGAADSTKYVDTGVTVTVDGMEAEATVNYYTVSFYDAAKEEVNEDTRPYQEKIVPEGGTVSAPDKAPVKDGYVFRKWVRADGSAAFVSGAAIPITKKTDFYASWVADTEEAFTIRASAGSGGSVFPSGEVKVISGGSQQFAIRPEDGYRIASVLADGREMSGSGQIMDEPGARSVDAENGTKYYTFTNVASDHTLEVHFETVHEDLQPDDNEPDNNKPDDDHPDDNKPETYSVTYYVNGEAYTFVEKYHTYTYGTGLTLPIPDQAGYIFDGWYTDAGYTSEKANAISEAETGDKVYYGRLAENTEPQPEDNMPKDNMPDDNQPDDSNAQPDVSENTGSPEPKTGADSHIKIYATVAMIACFVYLLLCFMDEGHGLTEQRKKEIVDRLVKWSKKGNRLRRLIATTAIFFLMVYYHGIGKYTATNRQSLNK